MFVEMQRGRGFGGLTRYCLGPGEAGAADRVEAVETINLATRDPEAPWRVMAARHYLQDDLKAANGIRRGSPGKPVGHLLVSWSAEEARAQNLNPEGMLEAARGALAAMGAGDRQAIVIAHRDTENPHCHVVINLIGEDGRLKDNTDEKRKLSRWAMEHETRVHGAPIVRGRYRNWQDREAGETPPSVRKKARHLYELERAAEAGAVDPADAAAMLDAQRSLERRKERREARDADHRRRLKELRDERLRRAEAWGRSAVKKAKTQIRNARRADWDRLYDDQFEERRTFRENEESERGAMENALRLIDWNAKEPVRDKMSRLFSLTANMQSRRDALLREHERQKRATRDCQRAAEAAAVAGIRTEQRRRVKDARDGYRCKRAAPCRPAKRPPAENSTGSSEPSPRPATTPWGRSAGVAGSASETAPPRRRTSTR